MTIADLRVQVAAYANREQAEFVRGGSDLLLLAINRAKLSAQRTHDFEFLRDRLLINVDSVAGVAYPTSPKLKRIENAFLAMTPQPVLINYSSRTAVVVASNREVNMIDMQDESTRLGASDPNDKLSLQLQGTKLTLVPFPTAYFLGTAPVWLDVILWSPDYVTPADTDFFLDYGSDYMMYRAVQELNKYLKQPEKIQLAAESVAEAWQSFVIWDRSLADDTALPDTRQLPVQSHDVP